MLLLIVATIYIYRKFAAMAATKDLPSVQWGIYGSVIYLALGLGLQFLVGILVGLGYIYLDVENFGVSFVISIVSYGIGAIAAYALYNHLSNKPDASTDLDIANFGTEEVDDEKENVRFN